mmetsp:Transcript_28341/g.77808  ORF Transcript_28341/g.77808 Transcript_28341/m.77808 type:complete len:1156 (-) Transcript_28341:450-3917(-)
MFRSLRRRFGSGGDSPSETESSSQQVDGSTGNSSRPPTPPAASTKNKKIDREERKLQEWTKRVPQLANFDACASAADALAAAPISIAADSEEVLEDGQQVKTSGTNSSLARVDKSTGLVHTEVLVSPDGTLLLVPPGLSSDKLPFVKNFFKEPKDKDENGTIKMPDAQEVERGDATTNEEESLGGEGSDGQSKSDDQNKEPAEKNDDESEASTDSIFSELLWNSKDDYAAAIFLGHDLNAQGDAALNGFSAKGWSLPAISFAMRQTQCSLENLAEFCHSVILSRKESAISTHQACDTLRSQLPMLGGSNPSGTVSSASKGNDGDDWELVFDPRSDFCSTQRRCGPLLGTPNSSLNRALVLLEEYFSSSAEAESITWRDATAHSSAILPQLKRAATDFESRMKAREEALAESSKRAKLLEERLNKLKQERDKKWEYVYRAEEKVTRRMEALRKERARQRERARLNQIQKQAESSGDKNGKNEQVWDVVAAISDMDSTSFEPMHLNEATSNDAEPSLPNVAAIMAKNTDGSQAFSLPPELVVEPATISRETMEEEVRLPELRANAMKAEDAIEECASYLLTLLSNLDMTRRSARVAAETALLSAANAQASTVKELLRLERTALQERLQHLTELESLFELQEIDVRGDIKSYISADKRDAGGQSHMGDDDDGGVAAALSILSSHVEKENNALSAMSDLSMYSDDDDDTDGSVGISNLVSRDAIEEAVGAFFADDAELTKNESEDAEGDATAEQPPKDSDGLKEAIKLLSTVAKETSSSARRRRGTICYALNSKRSANAEIPSQIQFDRLVEVFDAVLTNCANDDGDRGLSHAKMLMMLAQTFYLQLPPSDDDASIPGDAFSEELMKQLVGRGFSNGDSTVCVAKGETRIKLGLDGYAALAMASAVIAEGKFTCTDTGVAGFTWENALKFEDEEWKRMDSVNLLNTFSILDDSVMPVKEDETPATLWGADKVDPAEALKGNGFLMESVVFVNAETSSPTSQNQDGALSPSRKGRNRRLYIKSRLTDHKIWSKDDFWDVALTQQVSESLAQSGVMSNFDRTTTRGRRTGGNAHEYKKYHKTKWHDLSLEERVGAASQVHAVVFAQLGALAHSMLEFGCGLQRSCAFVRRMSVQHQLPSSQRTMLLQHLIASSQDKAKQPN